VPPTAAGPPTKWERSSLLQASISWRPDSPHPLPEEPTTSPSCEIAFPIKSQKNKGNKGATLSLVIAEYMGEMGGRRR